MINACKPYIRLAGFLVCLVLLVLLANVFLLQTDTVAALTMREMKARDDIELAFVGSSVVRDHFDPALIGERTGKTAFCAAVPCASLPADIAMTEELLRTNSPEWVVFVAEPYCFNTAKEDLEAEYKLMPLLSSPRTALDYYLRLCREDGRYADRLLLFRTQMAGSLDEVQKTLRLRYGADAVAASVGTEMAPGVTYMGAGFLRYDVGDAADDLIRRRMTRKEDTSWDHTLLPASQRMLLDYRALCEAHGTRLMVVIYPMHTAHALAKPEYIPYNESLMAFCEENGIPCFNFSYAKPELLPRLDAYYFDLDHMNAEGAALLSGAFADFFNRYTGGEDVSGLFYAGREEYLASLDFITNCWVLPDGEPGIYRADCNRAPGVTPEYRFVLRSADGKETELRGYGEEAVIEAELPAGSDLRVYARVQGKAQDERVYYDYPTDTNPEEKL